MIKNKKPYIILITVFISIVITILALDCLGRMLLRQNNLPLIDQPCVNTSTYYLQPGESKEGLLHYQFRPGFKGSEWSTKFSINSFGFRGKEFILNKSKTTIRILCLGDSCTFGTGGLGNEDTYPAVLDRLLNAKFGAGKFEVINGGMPGFSVYQGFIFSKERKLIELKPDLVIICYGWNDHQRVATGDQLSAYIRLTNSFLFKHFAFYRYFTFHLQNKFREGNPTLPKRALRVNPAQYKYYLSKIIDLFSRNNTKIMILTAPWEPMLMNSNVGWLRESTLESFYLHPLYVDLTKRVCLKKNAKLIDLYALFELKKTGNAGDYFIDPFHYNKTSASLVASKIAEAVQEVLADETSKK